MLTTGEDGDSPLAGLRIWNVSVVLVSVLSDSGLAPNSIALLQGSGPLIELSLEVAVSVQWAPGGHRPQTRSFLFDVVAPQITRGDYVELVGLLAFGTECHRKSYFPALHCLFRVRQTVRSMNDIEKLAI